MSSNNGTTQPVVSPALAQPKVGEAAPSGDAPKLDQAALKTLIDERVRQEVDARLAALEDPTREQMTGQDDPFNNFDKKLELFGVNLDEILEDYHLHWINDERDRCLRMQVLGYTLVSRKEVALNEKVAPLNQDLGENIAVYVGGKEDGSPMRAYLMKIPKELYKKRQSAIEARNKMIDNAIRRGEIGPALSQGNYAGTDRGTVAIKYGMDQLKVAPTR